MIRASRERLASQWQRAKQHFMLVLVLVGVLWVVFIVDTALPDSWVELTAWGIRPRTFSGLVSIFAAPFLHFDFWHLLANTLPLVILGWILVLSGRMLFLHVCLVTALSSGAGAWAFGQADLVHEGASGVLFGLLGFLLARGWFARRVLWAVTSLGVGMFYLGEVLSLLRQDPRISWSSHFWGFAGGIALAWWMYGRGTVLLVPAVKSSPAPPSDNAHR
jgi:membrane associated rhomboid family serine protease